MSNNKFYIVGGGSFSEKVATILNKNKISGEALD